MKTTVGKILLRKFLPPDMAGYADKHLDQATLGELFRELADKHEADYGKYAGKLARLGFEVSTRNGSSISLEDLKSPVDKKPYFDDAEKKSKKIDDNKSLSDDEKFQQKSDVWFTMSDSLRKAGVSEGVKKNNTLAKMVLSGSRASPSQYQQTIVSPVLFTDKSGKPMVDMPIHNSYADGLSLPEYLAHTYGSRKGSVATKISVADSGYLGKQTARAAMNVKVEEHDCGTANGIPVSPEDRTYVGSVLAHPAGGLNRNNYLTTSDLAMLIRKGVKSIVVRTPMTCQSSRTSHGGAVCQLCIGKREGGKLTQVGDFIGVTASTVIAEPLAQSTLNTKHTSGGATKKVGGFKAINQLFNIPKTFASAAAMAPEDGKITKVTPAAQGGSNIEFEGVSGKKHELYAGAGFEVKVKPGVKVEAGDVLSDGIVNPSTVVQHKGIGEGRRYFSQALHTMFMDSGMSVHKKNFDTFSRAAINHVRITDPDGIGEHLPDSIVPYQVVEKDYKPRAGAALLRLDRAEGKYLEAPYLHYTIGTRVTPSVRKMLETHGVEAVQAHQDPPRFAAEMVRVLDNPAQEQDWMHQLYSTNLEKRIVNAVARGAHSDLKGASPIPGLAYGVGFGEK